MGLGLGRAGPWALAAAAAVLAVGAFYRAASGGGGGGGEGGLPAGAGAGEAPSRLHVGWVLARAGRQGWALRARGEAALRSLVRQVRLGPGQVLHLHLLCDADSRPLGQDLLRQALRHAPFPHQVWFHDVDGLAAELRAVVEAMQRLFSAGAGAYYGDPLFFLSVALHRLLPPEIPRIIQMDLDVEYRANILELFEEFDRFPEGAVIGIAREMQPVYRHIFWQYRQEHPGTKVGEPPPDGMPGFNSGVLLLNLDAMRQSALYNRLLEPEAVRRLAEKYHFKGHLGDQDFFTLAGMEHPALFHVLDCTWNRQLCSWWRDHGYAEVFDRYFQCDGDVKIYHGNCNTPIPAE